MSLLVAHRGDPINYRENTLPAFRSAEMAGADMIELDLHLSKDNRVVVLHDESLERLWNIPRMVGDMTYDEIRELTDGSLYELPLLDDVLQTISISLMLDIDDADVIEPTLAILHDADAVGRSLVVGGNLAVHRKARAIMPTMEIGLSWGELEPPPGELLDDLVPTYFNPEWRILTHWINTRKWHARQLKARGIGLSVWTVDDLGAIQNFREQGVDLIITNRIVDAVSQGNGDER